MTESTQTRSVGETVATSMREARTVAARALDTAQNEVRAHRLEMALLGATLLFAVVVGAIAFVAVFG